jgi:hypothetical protein
MAIDSDQIDLICRHVWPLIFLKQTYYVNR